MNASELMSRDPVTIGPEASVRQAVEALQSLEIRHLPVVDDEHHLVGMVSDRDLRALSAPLFVGGELAGSYATMLDQPVSTIMSSDVIRVDPEADVGEVVDLMLEHRVGAVPVVDEHEDALIGIVSYMDVLRGAIARD